MDIIHLNSGPFEELSEDVYLLFSRKKSHYTMEDGKEFFDAVKEISEKKGKKISVIIDMGVITNVDMEVMSFFSSDEVVDYFKAFALIARNYFSMIIGNLFIEVKKPLVRSRICKDREDAMEWIQSM